MPFRYSLTIGPRFPASGVLVVQREADGVCALVKVDNYGNPLPSTEFTISQQALGNVGRALIELAEKLGED